jgi:hypothetical protein
MMMTMMIKKDVEAARPSPNKTPNDDLTMLHNLHGNPSFIIQSHPSTSNPAKKQPNNPTTTQNQGKK